MNVSSKREAAVIFLDEMAKYWTDKAVRSDEDADFQAWVRNAENCTKAAEVIRHSARPVIHDPNLNGKDWFAAFCNSSEALVKLRGEYDQLKRTQGLGLLFAFLIALVVGLGLGVLI